MFPYSNYWLVRAIHEDRVRAAQTPVPEWIGVAAPRPRQPLVAGLRQHVRGALARSLRRLAASVDPQTSTVNA